MSPQNTPSRPEPTEIVTTRVFELPRAAVFGAFAEPARLARWWGPNGFTNTIRAFDLRAGGAWRLAMHGPDGATYENESEFVEVSAPERIVFLHLGPMHRFTTTMTYEAVAPAKTRLTWRMRFEQPESEAMRKFIAAANEENFDRLAAELRAAAH